MKAGLLLLLILSFQLQAADDGMGSLYVLSNQAMDIVTRTKDFPSKNIFSIGPTDSDLVLSLGKNDYLIGEYLGDQLEKETQIDCEKPKLPSLKILADGYDARKWRVGGMAISSVTEFEKQEKMKFEGNSYMTYLQNSGLDTNYKYSWNSMMNRLRDFDPNDEAAENGKRLANLIRTETGITIADSILASEFIYHDVMARPQDWKAILEKSKGALSFDQKMALVARVGTGSAFKQAQMLNALGVKDAYTVAYVSNKGEHSTVVAVDPADKNRIIKMNNSELYSDDGKKGMSVLDQDSTSANVGMQYKVYDYEGKPVASVPTEIGSILREVTGQSPEVDGSVNNFTLNKAIVGYDKLKGSLFSGKTSTGETITGVALFGDASTEHVTAEAAVAGYKGNSEKTNYSIDQKGLYGSGKLGLKATVYEGVNGKVGAGIGTTMEVLAVNAKSISVNDGTQSEKLNLDSKMGVYMKSNYELDLGSKDKIGASIEVKGRVDKNNIANEGHYDLQYESTVLVAKYDHKFSNQLKTSVAVAETLTRYGNSTAFKASLESGPDTFSVSGNVRNGDRAPAFFPGQQNSVKAAYERATSNGWNIKVEYGKNFDSKAYQFMATATKKF